MSDIQVSVIMGSYNHADHVESAIHSVLDQKGIKFEFLIEDDGSTDASASVISKVRDSRVRFFGRSVNAGACVTLNNLLARAKGRYVSVINSDDVWVADDKLAKQFDFLEKNEQFDACFGRVRYINAAGEALDKDRMLYGNIFDVRNMSRSEWIRHFFTFGNCLCHPTAMIRKSSFDKAGLYDNRLRQIPDLRQWINLIKFGGIHIFDEDFIQFRLIEGLNTSSATVDNSIRLFNEYSFVYEAFFDGIPEGLFVEAFSDVMIKKSLGDSVYQEIEQALLYFSIKNWIEPIMIMIGLKKVYQLLGDQRSRFILKSEYGIDDLWLQRKMAVFSPYVQPQVTASSVGWEEVNSVPPGSVDGSKSKVFFKRIPILRYFVR